MNSFTCAILLAAMAAEPPPVEPAHAQNSLYVEMLDHGLRANGQTVRLPEPRVHDGQAAEAQRSALREVAGSDRALAEMVRNAVTSPYIIRVRDIKTPDATIRVVDLWFVVYAGLAEVDPAREAARADGKEVEAGNMGIQTRLLKADDLRAVGIPASSTADGQNRWYVHIHGRLLDRIEFDVTNQVMATRSGESIVIAARTDPAFASKGPSPNGWKPLATAGGSKTDGAPKPYLGGISYTRISRISFQPEALLVESHSAFVEPHEWFQGAPILRSKFSLIAQDQIRSLRRELARRREKGEGERR